MAKRRVRYLIVGVVALIIGGIIYFYPRFFPGFILRYGYFVLLPIVVYSLLGMFFPAWRFGRLVAWTLLFGAVLMVSRFLRLSFLDTFRHTFFGRLFLTSPFHWFLLIGYLIGTYVAVSIDGLMVRRKR